MVEKDSSSLSQGLDDENPGHYLLFWKMPLKVGFVIGDILDGSNKFTPFDLQNSIHQEERIAMGKKFKDFFDIYQFFIIWLPWKRRIS